jgi:hypothetical protein
VIDLPLIFFGMSNKNLKTNVECKAQEENAIFVNEKFQRLISVEKIINNLPNSPNLNIEGKKNPPPSHNSKKKF